ncbi:hypothetical protein EIP86_002177 [Pleurotus ostreatoroseus]|nr:hypothetical protein EIP86_002177 [Pleurotus ostreatoroseus]
MARSPASSDDEAPEALSFSSSRQAAKAQDEALQQFHATEKQKLKDRRRERDRVLKDRKAQAKGKGKASEDGGKSMSKGKGKRKDVEAEESANEEDLGAESAGETSDHAELEARMARAMKDAEAEDDEGDDGDEDEDAIEDESEHESESERSSADQNEDMTSSEDDSDLENDDEESLERPSKKPKVTRNLDYLPDHLFSSALSEAASLSTTSAKVKSKPAIATAKPRKRKRVARSSKDLVVGTRTIRTLSTQSQSVAPPAKKTLAPPPAVTKFVGRTLNLRNKDSTARTKGWERRSG